MSKFEMAVLVWAIAYTLFNVIWVFVLVYYWGRHQIWRMQRWLRKRSKE